MSRCFEGIYRLHSQVQIISQACSIQQVVSTVVPLKLHFNFSAFDSFISQRIEVLFATAVRASDSECTSCCLQMAQL
jgi:hypothetical protein